MDNAMNNTWYVTTENGYYIAGPFAEYAAAERIADDREDLTGREHNVVGSVNDVNNPPTDEDEHVDG